MNGPGFNHRHCGRSNERRGFRRNRVSNRRQGHSEVQYPMAQKQSCRVACLPGVWKALVRSSATETSSPPFVFNEKHHPRARRFERLEPKPADLIWKATEPLGVGLSWQRYKRSGLRATAWPTSSWRSRLPGCHPHDQPHTSLQIYPQM